MAQGAGRGRQLRAAAAHHGPATLSPTHAVTELLAAECTSSSDPARSASLGYKPGRKPKTSPAKPPKNPSPWKKSFHLLKVFLLIYVM